MKKKFFHFLFGAALLCSASAVRAQGLENIIVEPYYTVTQADADAYNNNFGGGSYPLAAGMNVYRVYVDMAPNYKLNTVFGSPVGGGGVSPNPLDVTTTTTFWNDDNFGSDIPGQTRRLDEGTAFDSYITVNSTGTAGGAAGCGSAAAQVGVLRTADTDGNLTLCTAYPSFTGADGNVPGTSPALTYNIGGLINFSALTADGSVFQVINDAWATLPNSTGQDPTGTNRVLIGQFTTNGTFSFHLNVQLSSPTSVLETYVWNQAGAGEVVSPLLTYPSACTPAAITSATSNSPICSLDPLNLSVVATGTAPLSYTWTGVGTITNGGTANASVTGATTGNYNIAVSNACGNVNQNVAVVVNTATNWYADTDGDGFGAGTATLACVQPVGSVSNNTDQCPADANKQVPGACGCGVADVATTYYADTDGDGFGAGPAIPGFTCIVLGVTNNTDLCPADPLKQAPGACGCGVADVATTYYADTDGDGFGDPADSQAGFTCSVPSGFVTNNTDNCPTLSGLIGDVCNDNNPNTSGDVITANCVCAGVAANDCLGVPGGPAQPGTSCDDGLATTGNDTWSANCVCAGQLIDCLGVAGGSALPGTSCDDGLATTGNDTWSANCVCAGQLIDCLGVAGGTALPGTACNDNNPNTSGDVYGANCVCAGVLANDCLGVPGGPAQPGTSCDDGLATTGNDTWSANCVCAGQLIDCLGVAGGTALPGTSCDDGLATTGNDTWSANCVCAGQLIDCLGVAGGTALPGTACNDNNPNTSGDVYGANCVCAGVLANDCLGVPGGPAQPGTSCDDGLATTGNDTWSANCVCAGQLIDCLGVAGGTALPGSACNDNNPNTSGDVYGANCVCAGVLANDCLGVPGGPAVPGTACNDNNPNTINDVYGANCVCAGTPVGGCDNWSLELTTDNAGSETTWEIRNAGTTTVVDAGGPYANNTTVNEVVCLIPGACYELIVTDANGMSNGPIGGFVLRDQNGKRVLDNAGDGVFTGISQAVAPFCSPVGNDAILASQCDKVDWTPNQFLIATPNSAVSAQYGVGNQTDDGYEFRLFNPDGGYDRTVYQSHANTSVGAPAGPNAAAHLNYSALVTNPVPQNVLLNVRVRSRVNGVFSAWGPACRFKIDAVAANCPAVQLVSTPGSQFSCGATNKIVGNSGPDGRIVSTQASRVIGGVSQQANRYQFDITTTGGYSRTIVATTRTLVLGQWYTNPLLCGFNTYSVRVRASFDGGATWCPYGATCSVGITNNLAAPFCTSAPAFAGGDDDRVFFDGDETSSVATLSMWPNPNRGDQLYLTIDQLNADVTTATVDIFDLYGKKVTSRTIAINGSTLNTVINLDGTIASGMYLVNLTAGEQTFIQRLVIQ